MFCLLPCRFPGSWVNVLAKVLDFLVSGFRLGNVSTCCIFGSWVFVCDYFLVSEFLYFGLVSGLVGFSFRLLVFGFSGFRVFWVFW